MDIRIEAVAVLCQTSGSPAVYRSETVSSGVPDRMYVLSLCGQFLIRVLAEQHEVDAFAGNRGA